MNDNFLCIPRLEDTNLDKLIKFTIEKVARIKRSEQAQCF